MESSTAIFFSAVFLLLTTSPSNWGLAQRDFRCNSAGATCNALVDYVSPNATTLSAISTLFAVNNFTSILGANSLPISTLSNHPVAANQTIKIPFPCTCSNGTGVSNKVPIYTVVPGDFLDHIAVDVFSRLVTAQQIQAANPIPDANKITIGQRLHIPLPCSCDDVDGRRVVHYGLVVAPGSSLEGIAQQYNTYQGTLQRLNNITDPQGLQAGAILDVPLRACDSKISNNSADYPLLVSNGTYVLTAGNCVKCKCDASVSWMLQCDPSPNNSANCRSVRCAGSENLTLGNSTTVGCNRTTCAYAGFNNRTIRTTLVSDSTCPAAGPSSSAVVSFRGWNEVVVLIHVLLLCGSLLKWM